MSDFRRVAIVFLRNPLEIIAALRKSGNPFKSNGNPNEILLKSMEILRNSFQNQWHPKEIVSKCFVESCVIKKRLFGELRSEEMLCGELRNKENAFWGAP